MLRESDYAQVYEAY